jgi:predicted nucleic acid-binding protein
MKRAFGDTFFFIALLNPNDSYHQAAAQLSREWDGQIITTRWVLAEIGNALSRTNGRWSFVSFLDGLKQQEHLQVLPNSDQLFEQGVELFAARPDKEWSLTDCISFAAMQAHSIDEAITGDHHFEQAGFKLLLKRAD